jgi:hypothetical protein
MALSNCPSVLSGGLPSVLTESSLNGLNGQTIVGNSAGAWAITANGTNQSITLTPSGTGGIQIGTNTTSPVATPLAVSLGGTYLNAGTYTAAAIKFQVYNDGSNVGGVGVNNASIFLGASYSTAIAFARGGVECARFASASGNLLLGGLTTDGGGAQVLQIPGVNTANWGATALASIGVSADTTAGVFTFTAPTSGSFNLTKKISSYNGVSTAGWGVPAIQAAANITAQTAAATICTYTVGAADGDFEVGGQMSVTASTTLVTTITCTYTDVASVARTMILPVQAVAGTFIAAGAITGAGASIWETPKMHIRAKAATGITLLTSSGTFTGVTYSASGTIVQLA